VTTTAAKYARLTAAMEDRRLELNLSWTDVSERGGPSVSRLGVIRRGATPNVSPLTRARIARALEWPRSYVDALLGDGPLDDLGDLSEFEKSIFGDERLTDQQRRAIVEIYRSPGGWELLQSLVHDQMRARRA
jgi:hypothetical protein